MGDKSSRDVALISSIGRRRKLKRFQQLRSLRQMASQAPTDGTGAEPLPPGMRINMYGEEEPIELGLDDWDTRWERQHTGFHSPDVLPQLIQYYDTLTHGRPAQKIFVPLCGKSVDMIWLWERGHTVVGVESAELAIKEFFQDNKLAFNCETLANSVGKIFKTEDGRLRLYKLDLFNFTRELEGTFDGIWDKSSFIAINKADRKRYADTVTALMSPDCAYFLDVINYDPDKYQGPPHNVSKDEVDKFFGGRCEVTELEQKDIHGTEPSVWDLDWLLETLYLLRLKTT